MKLGLYRNQSAASVIEQTHLFVPDGPAYLMAYLEKKLGFTNAYVDYDIKKLIEKKPDIVGLSAVTESINKTYTLAAQIKRELNIPIVIGGPHTTYLPQSLPRTIDIGVIGEGEESFKEIMELVLRHELVPEKLREIKGIVYWDEYGNLQINESRPLIKNIDEVPLPKRRHIDNSYHPVFQNIITSRGCPYKCIFCIETRFWTTTRFHSPERVLSEIEEIIRYFPQQVCISMGDTIFAMHKKRLRRIAELIRDAGIHKKVYFACNARANIFDEEVCEILRSMNVKQINFGFESGSNKILDYLKGAVKVQHNEKALALCEKYGFYVLSNMLIGAPIETQEDAALSYWFLQHNNDRISRVSVHPMTPFPGSFIWRYANEKKLIDEHFTDWENFNLVSEPGIFLNENYTPAEFVEMGTWFYEYQLKKQFHSENSVNNNASKDLYFEHIYQKLADYIADDELNIFELGNTAHKLADYLDDKKHVTKVSTRSGYAQTKGLSENNFDLIVLIHTLETLRNPYKTLKNLTRLLKSGGRILGVFYNCLNKGFIQMLLEKGEMSRFVWGPSHWKNLQMFTLKNVEAMFNEAAYHNFLILQKNMNPTTTFVYTNLLEQITAIPSTETDVTSYVIQAEI